MRLKTSVNSGRKAGIYGCLFFIIKENAAVINAPEATETKAFEETAESAEEEKMMFDALNAA